MGVDATSWLEVDRAALRANLGTFQRTVGPATGVCAVVKSNAYGHGMVEVARTLQRERLWGFGVADLSEALLLRRVGIRRRILAMSSFADADVHSGIAERVDFTIFNHQQALLLEQRAARRTVNVHVKVDTGTTRLGVAPDNLAGFVRRLERLPALRLVGVMSHLADAEGATASFTKRQLRVFDRALQSIRRTNVVRHISCSASALRYPASRYDLVRIGIGLYGVWPSGVTKSDASRLHPGLQLRPVLSWKTRLLQVRQVARGTNIGYGRAFTAPRSMTIGTIPVGYWDGLRRSLSNRGSLLLAGKRCRIVGRVCMNLAMLNCSAVRHPSAGDVVTILGGTARHGISADEIARTAGTISYDMLSGIHPRLPRILV